MRVKFLHYKIHGTPVSTTRTRGSNFESTVDTARVWVPKGVLLQGRAYRSEALECTILGQSEAFLPRLAQLRLDHCDCQTES